MKKIKTGLKYLYITIFLLIVFAVFFVSNKYNVVNKIKNQALTMGFSSGSGSHSGQSGFASGSGSATNTGSGSGTNSTSKTLSLINLYDPYNMYLVQIGNLTQLQEFYLKTKFLTSYDGADFYSYTKNQIIGGSKINLYLEKSGTSESAGVYANSYYLNKDFIVQSSSCAERGSVKNKQDATNKLPVMPILSGLYGTCGLLSVAHSVNTTLGLIPPNGMATSSVVNGKIVWNSQYLEWLMQNVINKGETGISLSNLQKIYKKYKNTFLGKAWMNIAAVTNMDNILKLFWNKKTDCMFHNWTAQGNGSHISHIKNIYKRVNPKTKKTETVVELTNTLDQGDKNNNGAPTNPGSTVLVIDSAGKVSVSHHTAGVSKVDQEHWAAVVKTGMLFQIICTSY